MPFWQKADLEARLSAEVVRQILDDANSGTANPLAVARLQEDSDALVESYLVGIYDLDVVRSNASAATILKSLSLDAAVVFARQRHSEYVRGAWGDLNEQLMKKLEALRTQKMRLNISPTAAPEPAAPLGGSTWAGDNDYTVENEPVFVGPGRLGDF